MRLIIFLLMFVSANLFAQIHNIEDHLDSLVNKYMQDNRVSVLEEELIGTYSLTHGFFNQTLELGYGGYYAKRFTGCFGGSSVEKGQWEIKGGSLYFVERKNKKIQVIPIKNNEEIELMFPDSDEYFKSIARDLYNFKGEGELEKVVVRMEDIIKSQSYKKIPSPNKIKKQKGL